MKDIYLFDYTDELKYKKSLNNIKKIYDLAYKKLYNEYYPLLKEGNFIGELISEEENIKKYKLKLPSEMMFINLHGNIELYYNVNLKDKIITLDYFEPKEIIEKDINEDKSKNIFNNYKKEDKLKKDLLNLINDK